jgi:hypothetical protein
MNNKKDDRIISFLSDIQKEGKATGKIAIEDFEEALAGVSVIMNKDIAQAYHDKKEEDWPTAKMAIYCHDCCDIVPAGIGKSLRGNPRTVCGICSSKKISSGRPEALESFYHIEENKKKREDKAKVRAAEKK